jgi:hypothetical protein
MSNHFTYEIDERNLRLQLKGIASPVKEEAWTRFEAFLNSQPDRTPQTKMPNFQVALNRNIILPAVFALVIILFSFLLFNFISIHNPTAENKEAGKNLVIITPPELRQKGIPVQSQPEIKSNVAGPAAIKEQEIKITADKVVLKKEPLVENKTSTNAVSQNKLPPVNITAQKTSVIIPAAPLATTVKSASLNRNDPEIRKKRKQRVAEIVETEHLPDIRPELISQERNEEVRPD